MPEQDHTPCPHCGERCELPCENARQTLNCSRCQRAVATGTPSPSQACGADSTAPILDYYSADPGRRTDWMRVTCLVVFILMLMGLLWLPALRGRHSRGPNRVPCASNIRQIGQALMLYANENKGQYPPRLEDLLLTQQISSEVFVCPNTNDTAAPGLTSQAQAANLSAGGHLSYVYVGKNLTWKSDPEAIVLYEPLKNNAGDGAMFLFAEGHVEFVDAPLARKMIDEIKAGHNPPRSTEATNQP